MPQSGASYWDEIEIQPVKELGNGVCETVNEGDEDFWSVYLHQLNGGVKCVADLKSKQQAKKLAELIENLEGESKIREVKTRVNQNVFRQIMLANYNNKCAVTGFSNPAFLIASHIIPWSVDKQNRLNPQNGILLNNLHDKAFENGYLAINNHYQILICSELRKSDDEFVQNYFKAYHKNELMKPERFLPDI